MLNEVMLSSGRMFNIHRCRSEGPLNAEEIEYCRVNEIGLAYDPIQIGWITRTCEDDISPAEVGLGNGTGVLATIRNITEVSELKTKGDVFLDAIEHVHTY